MKTKLGLSQRIFTKKLWVFGFVRSMKWFAPYYCFFCAVLIEMRLVQDVLR